MLIVVTPTSGTAHTCTSESDIGSQTSRILHRGRTKLGRESSKKQSTPSESAVQLKKHVEVLVLEVESIVPIHGIAVQWEDFVHWVDSK